MKLKRGHKKKSEYRRMRARELEREANIILFGSPEEPKRTAATQYQLPKKAEPHGARCSGCGKPRARGSAGICRKCFLLAAKKKRIGAGKELVSDAEFERLTSVGYDFGDDGKVYRFMGVTQPTQIDDVWLSQISRLHKRLHRRNILVSFEDVMEMLETIAA